MSVLVSAIPAPRRDIRWLRGLRMQTRIIGALIMRDALSRYGHEHLGFFWVVGEPLILTVGVMILWSITHQTHGGSGGAHVGVVPFALTGYTIITMWRHIVFRFDRIMSRNINLVFHRKVKMLDILIARGLLETSAIFSAFMVAQIPLSLVGLCFPIRDPLVLIVGYVLTGWFAFAFGLVVAGLSEISDWAGHLLAPTMYITLPFTGVFYLIDWLPSSAQRILAWSPLVNGVEMFRSGLFPLEITTHYSWTYLLVCCIVFTAIGLPLCRYAERHIEMM